MAYRPTSKVIAPLKTSWSPSRKRVPWKTKVLASTGTKCGDLACDEEYIWEISRILGERFKEHLKKPTPICDHFHNTGHTTAQDTFQMIGREDHGFARTI